MCNRKHSLAASMLIWAAAYFGSFGLLLKHIGLLELLRAIADSFEIRLLALHLLGLGAVYLLIGVTVLCCRASRVQRALLLGGTSAIAFASAIQLAWLIVSPIAALAEQKLVYGLGAMMTAIPCLLASSAWSFVQKQGAANAT